MGKTASRLRVSVFVGARGLCLWPKIFLNHPAASLSADLDEPGPRIAYANFAFTCLTGYALEEVIGRSPRFLQGPGTDRAELDAAATQA